MRTRTLAPLLALGLLLAACGEDGETADTGASQPGSAEEAPDEMPDEAPDEAEAASDVAAEGDVDLAVGTTELGEILVDGDGMTLYLFTQDPPGESVCTDDCLAAWPPLLVEGEPRLGDGVEVGLVGTITRDDGGTQVTYDDAPLYTWASDSEPGDVTGQDVQGVWFVVAPDGSAVMEDEDEDAGRDPSY
jgi:predicted lipoprotein with Yx(FWY)xxD motif